MHIRTGGFLPSGLCEYAVVAIECCHFSLGFEVELRLRSAEQVGRDFKFRLKRSDLILRAPFFV